MHHTPEIPQVGIDGRDQPGREKLRYHPKSRTVISRSKMHPGLKRSFEMIIGSRYQDLSGRPRGRRVASSQSPMFGSLRSDGREETSDPFLFLRSVLVRTSGPFWSGGRAPIAWEGGLGIDGSEEEGVRNLFSPHAEDLGAARRWGASSILAAAGERANRGHLWGLLEGLGASHRKRKVQSPPHGSNL